MHAAGVPSRQLRRARLATIALFLVCGLTLAVWVVSIPAVQQQIGISNGVLGSLLLLLGLGAFLGMNAAGFLVDRIGSKRTALLSAILLISCVNLPGIATAGWQLGVALLLFGIGSGSIDVAMNDQAVIVERGYGRPIMSNFHAYFAVGGGAGALLGAGTQALGLTASWTLGAGATIAILLTALSFPALLPRTVVPGGRPADEPATAEVPIKGRRRRTALVVMGILAFLSMLAEGSANDWSALHAVEHLGQPTAMAALAYGAFAVAMTIGRFSADYVAARLGPVQVVRIGSAVATGGLITVALSPVYPLTLVGWAIFGIGLSGIIPQIFTAAGNLGGANQGVVMSRVVGAGYLGLLAGPAVIGWMSDHVGLNLALLVPMLCAATGVLLAGFVTTTQPLGDWTGTSPSRDPVESH